MNYDLINWNKEYNKFISYLYSLQDVEYKNFQYKIINSSNLNLIGVRTPIIKKIAKQISEGNYKDFIKNNKHIYYEEILIHGFIISYIGDINLLDSFLKYIDNWAINDLVVSNFKYFKNNQVEGFDYSLRCINDNNPWIIRFGLVLLINYNVNDYYIDEILNIVKTIKTDNYYVKMAIAWLICECFINYKNKVIELFKNGKLDKFIINKSISKISESYRVNKLDKIIIKKYKVR